MSDYVFPKNKPFTTRDRIQAVDSVETLISDLKNHRFEEEARSAKRALQTWLISNETVDYDRLYVKYNRYHRIVKARKQAHEETLAKMKLEAKRQREEDKQNELIGAVAFLGAMGVLGGIGAWSAFNEGQKGKKTRKF